MSTHDRSSIGSVIAAGYECLSGLAGERDWARFRTLYAPGARFSIIDNAETGAPALRHHSVEEYIARVAPLLMEQDFYEVEIGRREERFGRIAHAFSTYASLREPEGEPFMRGINSFQLIHQVDGWLVVSVYWDRQPLESVPAQYLRTMTAEEGAL